jgi:hypothetical protein
MRKALLVFLIIALLTISLLLEVSRANPIAWPTIPNKEKPILEIKTPQNNMSFDASDSIYLNFSVTEPESWNVSYMNIPFIGEVNSVDVSLDGNLNNHLMNHQVLSKYTEYSVLLNQTSPGQHSINVTVYSNTHYLGPPIDGYNVTHIGTNKGPLYNYPITVSQEANFTINPPNQQNTSTQPPESTQTNDITTWELAFVIAVVVGVVPSLILFCYKRHKSKTASQ